MFMPDFSGGKSDIFGSMHNATHGRVQGTSKEYKANRVSLRISLNASESYQS